MLGFSFRRLREERDGRSGSGGRAGAAEIAWEEARDGGARSKVRIRWTVDGREVQKLEMEERDRRSGSGGRAVDGLWTGGVEIAWGEARDGGAVPKVRIRWTGGGRAVDGREAQK